MKNILYLIGLALLCCGCAHPRWTPYVGSQQEWRTSPGSLADLTYPVPVYYGLPPKPYEVLGSVHLWTESNIDLVRAGALEAKQHGADAVLVGFSTTDQIGSVTFANAYAARGYAVGGAFSAPVFRRQLDVMAVKWFH
jgi:hypothetical protein